MSVQNPNTTGFYNGVSLTYDIAQSIFSDWGATLQGDIYPRTNVSLKACSDGTVKDLTLAKPYGSPNVGGNYPSSDFYMGWFAGIDEFGGTGYAGYNRGTSTFTGALTTPGAFFTGTSTILHDVYWVFNGETAGTNNTAYFFHSRTVSNQSRGAVYSLTGTVDVDNNPRSLTQLTTATQSTSSPTYINGCMASPPGGGTASGFIFQMFRNASSSGNTFYGWASWNTSTITYGTLYSTTVGMSTNVQSVDACYAGFDTSGYDVVLFLRGKNNSGFQVHAAKRANNNNQQGITNTAAYTSLTNFSTGYNGGITFHNGSGYYYAAKGEVFNSVTVAADNVNLSRGTLNRNGGATTPILGAATSYNVFTSQRARAVTCEVIAEEPAYNYVYIFITWTDNASNQLKGGLVRHTTNTNTVATVVAETILATAANINHRITITPMGQQIVDESGLKVRAYFDIRYISSVNNTAVIKSYFVDLTGGGAALSGNNVNDITTTSYFGNSGKLDLFSFNSTSNNIGLVGGNTLYGTYAYTAASSIYPGYNDSRLPRVNILLGNDSTNTNNTFDFYYYS